MGWSTRELIYLQRPRFVLDDTPCDCFSINIYLYNKSHWVWRRRGDLIKAGLLSVVCTGEEGADEEKAINAFNLERHL
jgi:hypothetical protein